MSPTATLISSVRPSVPNNYPVTGAGVEPKSTVAEKSNRKQDMSMICAWTKNAPVIQFAPRCTMLHPRLRPPGAADDRTAGAGCNRGVRPQQPQLVEDEGCWSHRSCAW